MKKIFGFLFLRLDFFGKLKTKNIFFYFIMIRRHGFFLLAIIFYLKSFLSFS